MLQVARLAPGALTEAAPRVAEFLRSQFNTDGGARDRSGASDLYYTVFALEGLIALREEPPLGRVRPYLERFGDGDGLDLVHLCCLARCWAAFPRGTFGRARALARRIASHEVGSIYQAFLSLGAFEDLGAELPGPERLARFVASLELEDGSFANEAGVRAGATTTTAAAVTLLRQLGAPSASRAGEWLLARAHPKGGFAATAGAPIPDLLSTATALHALAGLKVPVAPLKEAALDFLDTLWTGKGFCGNWTDDVPDGEYTYYALLSLGHLSLA